MHEWNWKLSGALGFPCPTHTGWINFYIFPEIQKDAPPHPGNASGLLTQDSKFLTVVIETSGKVMDQEMLALAITNHNAGIKSSTEVSGASLDEPRIWLKS